MEKIDARTLSADVQQQLRHQAIKLKKSGRTYKEISEIIAALSDHPKVHDMQF